jgi:mycothione reductase
LCGGINGRPAADQFVLAAGSRPVIPPVPGLASVPYHTSDTIMRLGELPGSMVVLGGGYIAAEMSHIFGSLCTKVTIVTRGSHLLSGHDADIRDRFTQAYAEQRPAGRRRGGHRDRRARARADR